MIPQHLIVSIPLLAAIITAAWLLYLVSRNLIRSFVIATLIILSLYSYYRRNTAKYEYYKEQRRQYCLRDHDDINIALVWPTNTPYQFIEGVTLAAAQLNTNGVLSKKIRLHTFSPPDDGNPRTYWKIARQIARNPAFVAVLGYDSSTTAIAASITFDYYGILFLTPVATSESLTEHRFDYVLRIIPTDNEYAAWISSEVMFRGATNVALLHARNHAYAVNQADAFRVALVKNNITIVYDRSYLKPNDDFRLMIAELREFSFDAIIIADVTPHAARLIKQLRDLGIYKPIYGGDGLDSAPDLNQVAGAAANGTYVATLYCQDAITNLLTHEALIEHRGRIPHENLLKLKKFVQDFRARFARDPDFFAVQGFESLTILAQAYERTGITTPISVGNTLKAYDEWSGLYGKYSFSMNGNVENKPIFTKVMTNGVFRLIPTAEDVP